MNENEIQKIIRFGIEQVVNEEVENAIAQVMPRIRDRVREKAAALAIALSERVQVDARGQEFVITIVEHK